jgi:hypothetical protein
MRRERLIYLALALVTAIVFWPVSRSAFISLDDENYVTANAVVCRGLNSDSVAWSFHAMIYANWHPLTWLSHMLDCQFFGVNAPAHHLVNLAFHLANTLLLFHWLRQMTRQLWPSALVAAFFALHPLHVESVAWVSERKDVLSTFFGLLSLIAYVSYAQGIYGKTKLGSRTRSSLKYFLALLFLAMGLMSKPMLVTWPCLFLLLDVWPLGRVPKFDVRVSSSPAGPPKGSGLNRLLLEKLPFFALSAASSAITVVAQSKGGALVDVSQIGLSERIGNSLISYARYLGKTFWPDPLVVFYPHPLHQWPVKQIVGAVLLLAAITAVTIWQARRRPVLMVGWLWFLGTLVPVIGLLQVGLQSMADRYMYVPSIGLFIMIVWAAREWILPSYRVRVGAVLATAALAGCILVTRTQLGYWRNSETLFRHAANVTPSNPFVEYLLGNALIQASKTDEGLQHLQAAARSNSTYAPAAHVKIGELLSSRGQLREAIEQYHEALRGNPDMLRVLNNLAWVLASSDDPDIRNGPEAVGLAEHACELTQYRTAVFVGTLAAAYAEAGRFEDAIRTAEKASELAIASGANELAEKNLKLLKLYREGRPYHESAAGTAAGTAP